MGYLQYMFIGLSDHVKKAPPHLKMKVLKPIVAIMQPVSNAAKPLPTKI